MRPGRDRREQCIRQLWRDLGAPGSSANRWTQQAQFEQQEDAQLREEWTLATPDDVGSATTVSHVLQDDLDTQAYPQVRTDPDTLQEQSDMTLGELPAACADTQVEIGPDTLQEQSDMTSGELPATCTLQGCARCLLQRLPSDRLAHLRSVATSARSQGRPLRLATMYSGTDGPVPVVRTFCDELSVPVEHVWSCDSSPHAQAWIRKNFPQLRSLYASAHEVSTGRATNVLSGEVEVVGAIDVLIAGFSCKDVSAENAARTFDPESRSGSTFRYLVDLVTLIKPMLVIWENVLGLRCRVKGQPAPIHHVVSSFVRIGYANGWGVLSSASFFLPQRRYRCYGWAFRGLSRQSVAKDVMHTLKRLSCNRCFRLGRFFKGINAKRHALLPRERRVLKVARSRLARPSIDDYVADVAKSDTRVPVSLRSVPCVVPNSRMYRPRTGQRLLPRGMLALQGIFPHDFPALQSDVGGGHCGHWASLAGNAMTTTVVLAVFTATCAHAPELLGGHWDGVGDAVVAKRRLATCAHAPELLGGHWEGAGDAVVVKRRPCSRAKAGISQPSSGKAGGPVAPGCTWLASLGRHGAYRAKVWIKGKEVSLGYFHAESGSLHARQEALNLAIQARARARLRGQA